MRRGATRSAPGLSRLKPSFALDTHRLDDLGPLLRLEALSRAEFLGRVADDVSAEVTDSFDDFRVFQDPNNIPVNLKDDFLRRRCRCEQSEPVGERIARH